MTPRAKHIALDHCLAAVWFVNGFLCKMLNLVPRHQQIVAEILGYDHARLLTFLIGISEVLIGCWILSELYIRLCAVTQILVIAIMNILEFILVPNLLLWGKANAIFAFLLILLIYYNEFQLRPKSIQQL